MLPTRVSQLRSRYPLRSPLRCAVRSYLSAPTCCAHFELHQLLGHGPHAFTQKVNVLVELGLAQQLKKSHPQVFGHRFGSPFSEMSTIPMGTAGGRPRQRPMSIPTHRGTQLTTRWSAVTGTGMASPSLTRMGAKETLRGRRVPVRALLASAA